MPKRCSACKVEKGADYFTKWSYSKDGLSNQCKECQRKGYRKYYLKNKEKVLSKNKAYSKNNRTKINQASRRKRRENPEKYRLKDKIKYHKNPKEKLEKHRIWSLSERGIIWRREYKKIGDGI